MKTLDEFNLLYSKMEGVFLEEKNNTCKAVRTSYVKLFLLYFVGAIFLAILAGVILFNMGLLDDTMKLAIIVTTILSIVTMIEKMKNSKFYLLDKLKSKVYNSILKFVDSRLHYDGPKGKISYIDIKDSRLLSCSVDRAEVKSFFSGMINDISVEFAEILVKSDLNSAGSKYSKFVQTFQGIFAVIKLEKSLLKTHFPDGASREERNEIANQLIYSIIADNIAEIRKSLGKKIKVSVRDYKIYVAFQFDNQFFNSLKLNNNIKASLMPLFIIVNGIVDMLEEMNTKLKE